MRVEFARANVQPLEDHPARRPIVRPNGVVTEHGNAGKRDIRKPARVVARGIQDALDRRLDHRLTHFNVTSTGYRGSSTSSSAGVSSSTASPSIAATAARQFP